ncbi:uncharacterized protein [Montipora capricornis]|uniref:uncharacterized protein n=1 Tax=Montipora capricornis TaxID=246305 RepID=UPI0035F1604E
MERNALRADDISWLLRFAWLPSALCFEGTKTVGKEMSQILPYQLEPEFSSTNERSESEEEGEDDSVLSNANTSECRLDTSWCLCEQCAIMPTEVASICCKEPAFLSKMVEGLSYITEHSSFQSVCLNRDVLWTALVSLHDRESAGLPDRQQVFTRSLRHAAYRQLIWWATLERAFGV